MPYPTTTDYTFDEGIDPTSTWGVYASVLLQLIRQAKPNSYRGSIIYSDTTPTVTGDYEWHKRCLWIKTTAPNAWHVFAYDNDLASWVDVSAGIGAGAINDEAQIADNTIPLSKLKISAITRSLLQVNASGNALEAKMLDRVLYDGFMPIDYTFGYDLYIVRDGSSQRAIWRGIDPSRFNFASIPVSKLIPGAVGTSPVVNSAGAVEWQVPTISTLPTGAAGGSLSGTYPNPIIANSGVVAGQYGGAGKMVSFTVNAEGRVTAASDVNNRFPSALLCYQTSKGTVGSMGTTSGSKFPWNTEIYDADNIVSISSDKIVFAEAGTYRVGFYIPAYVVTTMGIDTIVGFSCIIDLYDETNAAIIDFRTINSFRIASGDHMPKMLEIKFDSIIQVPAPGTAYSLRAHYNGDQYLSVAPWPADISDGSTGYAERHGTVSIQRIA